MMASSTSTPSATAKPPRVMVFRVMPMRSSTATAASRDKGMARNVMKAERQSRRKRYSTARIRMAAITSDCSSELSARSTKLAGRCIAGYIVMPCAFNAGVSCASASSRARVVSNVLAPYWLASASRNDAGRALDLGVTPPRAPARSSRPRFATSPMVMGVCRERCRHHRARQGGGIGRGHRRLDQHPLMHQIDEACALQRHMRVARRAGQDRSR